MNVFSILTLGPAGSFSDQAARYVARMMGLEGGIKYTAPNERVVSQTLENLGRYIAVVPFETTGRGLVPEVVGELLAGIETRPKIYAEVVMPIEQCFAYRGDRERITTVVTHQQSVAQCKGYLKQLTTENPSIKIETVGSNSLAMEMAAKDDTVAAIGPRLAAELNGLDKIEYGIQDSKNNETRFIVIHDKDQETPTGNDRTTLVYKVANRPATLDNAISVFGRRGLNKSGQHSIATGMRLGEYLQLTEVEAHREDAVMKRALREFEEEWTVPGTIYIFGSYPRHVNGR